MHEIRHRRQARRDLLDIWLEVAAGNEAAANRLYDRLERRLAILSDYPEAGPARPDIAPDARMVVEPPYVILYRVIPTGVEIVRVLHGARRIVRGLFAAGLE